ncbi:ABC transporter substrate-binding protein [Paenibacillus hamazuiensis]|uniref:ABC transporter substrate-binding protein n=1 Tax=Paenibacillus hamazuiensis TaxID=2936508 RepID=UPI00200BE0DF|nr:extracellular solute-binding protein [Paenibacillus hamazuiensis]
MNKTRKVLAAALAVVVAGTLAACGVKEEEKPPAASPGAGNSSAGSDKKPVKLRILWWGSQARHDATLKALDLYTKKNPHVTFEPEFQAFDGYLDKISTMAAAKNLPDIVQTDAAWINDWGSTNRLMDLTNQINVKDVDQALLNTGKYKDKLYAVPLGNNAYGFVYNKAAVDKLGIAPPKYGWTWDEFFAFAKEARAKLDKDKWVMKDFTADYGVYSAYQVSKGLGFPETSDGKFNFDKATWLEYMNKMGELRAAGISTPPDVTTADKGQDAKLDLMVQDKILLRTSHAAEYPGFEALKKDQLALVNMPKAKQGGGWLKASMYWSISPDTKNADEAKKFIDWFINDTEVADILGTSRGVPVSKKVLDYLQPKFSAVDKAGIELIAKTAIDGATFDPGPGKKNNWDNFTKEYDNLTQQIMFGKMTPDQAWAEVEKLSKTIK